MSMWAAEGLCFTPELAPRPLLRVPSDHSQRRARALAIDLHAPPQSPAQGAWSWNMCSLTQVGTFPSYLFACFMVYLLCLLLFLCYFFFNLLLKELRYRVGRSVAELNDCVFLMRVGTSTGRPNAALCMSFRAAHELLTSK